MKPGFQKYVKMADVYLLSLFDLTTSYLFTYSK